MTETGHLQPGATVAGRYVVESLLGVGGLAEVYKVRHVDLGSLHALKLLTFRRKGYDERLKREGQIQANLRHPNVVTVTDIVTVDGQFALLMEYVDGTSLDALLAQQRQLSFVDAMALFAPVLAAVSWAHDAGAVHRDLKPGNVLLARTPVGWVPKVADFGIGKLVDAATGDGGGGKTRSGVAMGTPGYMAPEQVRDSATVDKRADVFALGVILYEMLEGRLPFLNQDGSIDVTTTLVQQATPLTAGGVPDAVAQAVVRAMSKEPEERYADARAFARALGLGQHPLFAESVTGGSLADITRSVSSSWSSSNPPQDASNATLSPPTNPPPNLTTAPSVVPPSAPAPVAAAAPARDRTAMMAMAAVPLAGLVLLVAVLAVMFSGGMVAHEMMKPDDEVVVVPAPPPDAAPPSPAPVPPTPDPVVPTTPEPVAPAPVTPVPGPVPGPAPGPVPVVTPGPVPVPAPDPVVEVQPVPVPTPDPVVRPAPAPTTPSPAPTAPTPAPIPAVAGSWSGTASNRPFELQISGAGPALSAKASFVAGATTRVEQLSGSVDAAGALRLKSGDGRIQFEGKVAGTSIVGTYMMGGGRPLPFDVSR